MRFLRLKIPRDLRGEVVPIRRAVNAEVSSDPAPEEVLGNLDPHNPEHVLAVVAWLRCAK